MTPALPPSVAAVLPSGNGPSPAELAGGEAERLLTADDVAALLQVPRSWVYAQSRAGEIPTVRLGRYYRYEREAVWTWVRGRSG